MNQKLITVLRTAWTEPRHFFLWLSLLSLLGLGSIVAVGGFSTPGFMVAVWVAACVLCFVLSVAAFVLAWIPPLRPIFIGLLARRFFVLACIVTVIALFYAVEDWRGRRAWQSFAARQQGQGERFDFASLIPPQTAPDRNFFETPLWNDLHFERTNGTVIWSDTNSGNRVLFNVFGANGAQSPSTATWTKSQRVDLVAWQSFYRSTNNVFPAADGSATNYFPVAPKPQAPAADVLLALSRFDHNRRLLIEAAARPEARFWINYDAGPAMLLPHLARVKGTVQYLSLHADAALKAGDTRTALEDIGLGLRLMDSVRNEPILISHLVRIAALQIILQPVWEGLADHHWGENELVQLETELGKLDFLADYQMSMRGERACNLWAIDYVHKEGPGSWGEIAGLEQGNSTPDDLIKFLGGVVFQIIPSGWFDQNKLSTCQLYESYVFPAVDQKRHIVSAVAPDQTRSAAEGRRWGIYGLLAKHLVSFTKASERFAHAQVSADEARIACALERYRLANGKLPETLDKLVPQFIPQLPPDVMNGNPLKYRLSSNGSFVLYSVGWNRTDEDGKIELTAHGFPNETKGDWVWRYPEN